MAFLKHIASASTDEYLIELYKQSADPKTLGELYSRYMELVYGVCLKYLKDPEDAKDAVLNIYGELVTKLQKHEVLHFKSWLYQLAKNHCLMRLRQDKKMPIIHIDSAFMQSEENLHLNGALEKEENLNQLTYCLGQLAIQQRRVIELFYLKGKCYNEIAENTGIEWNKVRSLIQNGRRNLKLCMDKQALKSGVSS